MIVADEMQKELRALMGIRRIRLQRAEAELARAQQAERRAAAEVVKKEEAAERMAGENKSREAALATELFQRKTVLSHIESFRREVGQLRKGTAQAREDVETARQERVKSKAQTREAIDAQRRAYRAVEKLEFSLQELAAERGSRDSSDSPDA